MKTYPTAGISVWSDWRGQRRAWEAGGTGLLCGRGARLAAFSLIAPLQERLPGGGEALPGLSAGRDGWRGRLAGAQ